jgi:hypothetical protein
MSAWQKVIGTSFADPEDVARFRRAKARGLSDREAFAYGDNGVGCWGDDTTKDVPMCALPPEDWKAYGKAARGRRVLIRRDNGLQVIAELRDTMPARKNIKNGAGIDMNPACLRFLGLSAPCRVPVEWAWWVPGNEDREAVGVAVGRGAVLGLDWLLRLANRIRGKR